MSLPFSDVFVFRLHIFISSDFLFHFTAFLLDSVWSAFAFNLQFWSCSFLSSYGGVVLEKKLKVTKIVKLIENIWSYWKNILINWKMTPIPSKSSEKWSTSINLFGTFMFKKKKLVNIFGELHIFQKICSLKLSDWCLHFCLLFGQRPQHGKKSCRMGRNSIRPSVRTSVRPSPRWLSWQTLRPL